MRRKLSLAVLGALMALVSLTSFGSGTALAPTPLQAQGCGAFDGQLCESNCKRECTTGGCCSWSYYYYSTP